MSRTSDESETYLSASFKDEICSNLIEIVDAE